MQKLKSLLFLFLLISWGTKSIAQTSSAARLASFEKINMKPSPFNHIEFRNIGPTIMSGRITDVEVNPDNSNEFYVAYASGGVWHSSNNGQSMTPIFDHEASITIGDMAMDWKSHTLWVGTGEVNSSRSSYAGTGIYKTSDTGKTWTHVGLDESHHIARIVVHPTNPNIAWVAILGHLYTTNKERGIFKTMDGGKTWKQTLYINDSTGCIDLQIDPTHPEIIYTSSWTRTRSAWNFTGCGEASGIYKSTDGGENWTVLTTANSGFPTGKGVGRIGLSVCQKNTDILYAVVDNNANQEKKEEKEKKLNARDIQVMSKNVFLEIENKKLEDYLRDNDYPEKYTAEAVKKSVEENEYKVSDIADWKLSDADANLFDTPIYGAELYRSDDAGKTWKKTHSNLLDGVFFTYGYYFGTLCVSPTNPDKICVAGYPITLSVDGGKTFKQIDGENSHPDYHRIWIDPNNDKHIIAANDGGLNITYDDGATWFKANNPAVGQMYSVAVDNAKPYNVYGGLQDNGTWTASSTTVESNAWLQNGQNPYKNIGDGDGMQVQVDTRDNNTVYVGYQFGNYFKVNKTTGESTYIKPIHDIGQHAYRFNWQTPILLSKHNQDIFYMGSNCFHRSLQQGNDIKTVSPEDLAPATKKGNVPFGTLTTITESPTRFGLLYVGSDDGNIYCSKDVGYNWTKVSNPLPQHVWVTRVIASKYKESRVYATLNAYRQDDFTAYVYRSDDYGKTWKQLGKNLPLEPVNVIKEDPIDENILYVGTDNGLYVSFNTGEEFEAWKGNLPRVAIHDIAIQERENEIVLGTHGRSIYISKLDRIQKYPELQNQSLVLLPVESVKWNKNLGTKSASYNEPRQMTVPITFFTKNAGLYTIQIKNVKGKVILNSITQKADYGYNTANYDMTILSTASISTSKKSDDGKYYILPGKYKIEIISPTNEKQSVEWEVKDGTKKEGETKEVDMP